MRSLARFVLLGSLLGACGQSGSSGRDEVADDSAESRDGGRDTAAATAAVYRAGVVEGFYGAPYPFEERVALVRYLGALGLDAYLYAPKDDPEHREQWRAPYSSEHLEHFRELAAVGRESGVRFVFGLSPGLSYDPADGDLETLLAKLEGIQDLGISDFCLLFDDVQADSPGADPSVQVEAVTATFAALRTRDPDATLCLVPNYYVGTAEQLRTSTTVFEALFDTGSASFYEAYRALPGDVALHWTGRAVFADRVTLGDVTALADFLGRPVVLWDNYPANDLLTGELFLGPYDGREPGVEGVLQTILLNPMHQPRLSRLALHTFAARLRQGRDYRPSVAWQDAVSDMGAGAPEAFETFAEQFLSHPIIGSADESPRLATAMRAYVDAPNDATRETLVEQLTRASGALAALQSGLADRALYAELEEPARKLGVLADAALLGVDLMEQSRLGQPVESAEFETKVAEADSSPWVVAANAPLPDALVSMLAEHPAQAADVFGAFFEAVRAVVGP